MQQERAFERAYGRHVGDVYRYALAVLSDPADAEEVTRATFRNAFRTGTGGQELNGLLAIAHEVCRVRGGHDRQEEADFVGGDERLTAAEVRRALGRLPFDERTVLVMREVEGWRCREIAEILAVPIAAVETLIFRSRRSLREELEGSLTCNEAEFAVSRALDERLSRRERRLLRAHLSLCEDCEDFARRQRAQRRALRSLAAIPLPESLQQTASFSAPRRLLI